MTNRHHHRTVHLQNNSLFEFILDVMYFFSFLFSSKDLPLKNKFLFFGLVKDVSMIDLKQVNKNIELSQFNKKDLVDRCHYGMMEPRVFIIDLAHQRLHKTSLPKRWAFL